MRTQTITVISKTTDERVTLSVTYSPESSTGRLRAIDTRRTDTDGDADWTADTMDDLVAQLNRDGWEVEGYDDDPSSLGAQTKTTTLTGEIADSLRRRGHADLADRYDALTAPIRTIQDEMSRIGPVTPPWFDSDPEPTPEAIKAFEALQVRLAEAERALYQDPIYPQVLALGEGTPTTLTAEIADCIRAARAEGWTGDDREYELTALDCESITGALGRKPTREEWAAAGYPGIGSDHVAPAIAVGDIVESGEGEDHDTGVVHFLGTDADLPEAVTRIPRHDREIYVGWRSGVSTWVDVTGVTRVGADQD